MKIIDAHHHTWDRTVFPYSWMDDPHPVGDISDLKKNYLIEDLLAVSYTHLTLPTILLV